MTPSRPLLPPEHSRENDNVPRVTSNRYGTMESRATKDTTASTPESSTFYVSEAFVSWMTPIFKIGYRRQLQEEDINEMRPEHRTKVLSTRLQECWDTELRRASTNNRHPSLFRAIGWFILPHFWFGQVCCFICGKKWLECASPC